MNGVLISAGARQSVLAMQLINRQMSALQMNLATGRKVNSPSDNPAAYFTSVSLSSRARGLDRLLTDITTAQNTLKAADSGIAAIQALVTSAQNIANQALQSPDTLITLTGTRSGLTAGATIATAGGSATNFRNGDQVTVSDGTTVATYDASTNDTVQDFLDAVNNTANLKVTASLDGSGQIVFEATEAVDVTIGATLNGAGGATLSSIIGHGTGTTTFTANATRQSLATQFDDIRAQIDQVVADASFNGVNLLSGGSLSVAFNENGSSSYAINGVQFSSSGIGLSASTGQFQTDADVNAALADVTSAISTLKIQSSQFGSGLSIVNTRSDFTKGMVDFLDGAAEELVAADTNADGAALLALQSRQELAAAALSLTQSAETAVLRLFKI